MYLPYPATTSFPAICGANYPTFDLYFCTKNKVVVVVVLTVVFVFQVPNGIGVILGSVQLFLFVIYPSTAQRTITYDMKSPKPV